MTALFILLSALRRWAYAIGLLPAHRLPVPVVVVGNITSGGSGKTPLVIALAHKLRHNGFKPGIISRGYGGDQKLRMIDDHSKAEEVGDEAMLLWQKSGCAVAVGAARTQAAQHLLQRADCDVLLSDDGLQHLALARDLEIVTHDPAACGNGMRLPSGPLRESMSRLLDADWCVIRLNDSRPDGHKAVADAASATQGERLWMRLEIGAVKHMSSGNTVSLESLRSAPRLYALAAIAHPERFFHSLSELGFQFECLVFPDHAFFESESLPEDGLIIMTEKDAARCEHRARDHWYVACSDVRFAPTLEHELVHALLSLRQS